MTCKPERSLSIVIQLCGAVMLMVGVTGAGMAAESLVFQGIRDGKQSLFSLDEDGEVSRLTSAAFADSQPDLSPDGRLLLFTSNRDRNMELFVKDLGTGTETNLTNSPRTEMNGKWSPDGQKIAYLGATDSGLSTIMLINPDGSEKTQLTETNVNIAGHEWSPDGRYMAILQADSDKRNLYLTDLATGASRNLTAEGGGDNYEIQWSPDSANIYFISRRSRNEDIYRYELATGDETNLTNSQETEGNPRLSPDGKWLLFERNYSDWQNDLWVMNLENGSQHNLTETAAVVEFEGAWSGDSNHIVFVSLRDGNGELYRIDRGGEQLERLTNHPAYDSKPLVATARP